MTALSDLLAAANKAGLSARAIARTAQDRGHPINHDTAARYLRGDHGRPDEATLLAFADVLRIPLAKLRIAADLPAEQTAPYSPPPESSRLTRRQRRAVDEIIRSMLEPSRTVVTELPVTPATGRRAARHGEPESAGD
jgi:transcriptional regulator with XRE-family HTH domain